MNTLQNSWVTESEAALIQLISCESAQSQSERLACVTSRLVPFQNEYLNILFT